MKDVCYFSDKVCKSLDMSMKSLLEERHELTTARKVILLWEAMSSNFSETLRSSAAGASDCLLAPFIYLCALEISFPFLELPKV
jgi:hypothetical protein